MLKPILGLAATGVVAFILGKVLLVFLLPLVGIATGFLFLVLKVIVVVMIACVAIWLLRRWTRREEKLA